ncbi:MAG TPA: translation initiation factor IF-1 [Planctomycetes bacterium]|jgi:translation initiation factor IF-1|nr:translation initiation factor IF-1 [Planctomycetota bacterium]
MSRQRRGSGGGPSGSVKEEAIEVEGEVVQALGAGRYRVRIDGSDHEPICKTGGKMGRFRIKITPGDRVRAELSPYDLSRGRITYRLG